MTDDLALQARVLRLEELVERMRIIFLLCPAEYKSLIKKLEGK